MPHPLFFLHIPKTAGTTLNNIFNDNIPSDAIFDLYTDEQLQQLEETTYEQIAKYKLVRGHIFISDFKDILDGPVPFRVFTFLRDPIKRVVSEFNFLKSWPKSHLYSYLNENDVSLVEYVTSKTPMLRQRGRNGMVNSLSGVGAESVDERLERAWYHLQQRFVGFGILERFDESLLLLKQALGLEKTFYEMQNVRSGKTVEPPSEEELEVIREHNQADIELYRRASVEFDSRVTAKGPAFQTELRMFGLVNERVQRISELVNQKVGLEHGELINSK